MKKTYKCSNVKFCMEDENQRRTWEYLQMMTRKEGSYGKTLSDAFVAALDEAVQTEENSNSREYDDGLEETLGRLLDRKIQEMFTKMHEYLAEEIGRDFKRYVSEAPAGASSPVDDADMDGTEPEQAEELSEEMMDFAFAASAPQGALLLMRSVRSHKALLLAKVTKP